MESVVCVLLLKVVTTFFKMVCLTVGENSGNCHGIPKFVKNGFEGEGGVFFKG